MTTATLPGLDIGTVRLHAMPTQQGRFTLFVGVARAEDLIRVMTVDRFNPDLEITDPDQGYQRPPEHSRITKIGSYLIDQGGDHLFPTAVLLSARFKVDYNRKESLVILHPDQQLQVIDGQHRLFGLRYAIEDKKATAFKDFAIPFVLMEMPEKVTEMEQFRTVNGTAKSVRTDLVSMLLAGIVAARGEEHLKDSERWKVVVSYVVQRLVLDEGSPWYGAILMPGEKGGTRSKEADKLVRATSFMTSLQPVYTWLKEAGWFDECVTTDQEADVMTPIVVAYWEALRRVVPDAFAKPQEHVIQKTPGLFSLHKLMRVIMKDLHTGRRGLDVDGFVDFLGVSPEITDAGFWSTSARRASVYGSMKGFDELYHDLRDSIPTRSGRR